MNNLGMNIHIRTKFTRQWLHISAAVIHIGQDTLEVMDGLHEYHYWVNNVSGKNMIDAIELFESISVFLSHLEKSIPNSGNLL